MSDLLEELSGGDLGASARTREIAQKVIDSPALLAQIIAGFSNPDRVVRMRAAAVTVRVSRALSGCLEPHAEYLMTLARTACEPELRRYLAQLLPRIGATEDSRSSVVALLLAYLDDTSEVVRATSLHSLVELTVGDARLAHRVRPIIEELARTERGAVAAQALKLKALLD